jgi:hypothetical protein
MQYIKHYYVDDDHNTFCCEVTPEPKYKRHPWKEYAGLDVKVWLTDSDNVDVCLAELPDTTPVSTLVDSDCGKNQIQVLTEAEYNSVATPYFEAQTLSGEAQAGKTSMVMKQPQKQKKLLLLQKFPKQRLPFVLSDLTPETKYLIISKSSTSL